MEEAFVLEDEDTAGLGVYVDSFLALSVEEGCCAALEIRCRIILDGVVQVEMDSVERLKFLPRTFGVVVCTITVSYSMLVIYRYTRWQMGDR